MIVTGQFFHVNDSPRAGVTIQFISENTPFPDGLGVITAPTVEVVTDDNGIMPSVILEQGNYLVRVGLHKRDFFRIAVPDSNAIVNITSLMTAVPIDITEVLQLGVNFRVIHGLFQLLNITTNLWHTVRIIGEPGEEEIDIAIPGES